VAVTVYGLLRRAVQAEYWFSFYDMLHGQLGPPAPSMPDSFQSPALAVKAKSCTINLPVSARRHEGIRSIKPQSFSSSRMIESLPRGGRSDTDDMAVVMEDFDLGLPPATFSRGDR
jgi:hypothetical protein